MQHPLSPEPIPERHAAVAATWKPGQRWETCVDGCDIWVPVGNFGFSLPMWSDRQDYRQVDPKTGVPVPAEAATS